MMKKMQYLLITKQMLSNLSFVFYIMDKIGDDTCIECRSLYYVKKITFF